jgi:hypothetical protein
VIDLSDIITTLDFESLRSAFGGNDDSHKRLIGKTGEQMVEGEGEGGSES